MSYQSTLTKRRQFQLGMLLTALLALTIAAPTYAYEHDEVVEDWLRFGEDDAKYGQIKFDLRYRYENANQSGNNTPQTANGNTLRLRLGYLTPEFHGFQAFVEYEGNLAMQEDYNSLRNGQRQFSVIADPQEQELNQGWLSYTGIPDTTIKGGRMRIKLDNDRFIGNVGWRQMEQTFDAVMITNASIPELTIKAGYIGNTRTVISTDDNMTTPFLNMSYQFDRVGILTSYAYLIDYDKNTNKIRFSSQTYGASFVGSPKINDTVTAHYRAEYAWQRDYGSNPLSYQDSYYHIMAGATAFNVTIKGAMEQLNGNNGKGFDTPLGTNHAFQGWADIFLVTPANGVRDVYGLVSTSVYATKLLFVYHNFTDDTGNTNYGNEYDAAIVKNFGQHYQLLAKYAYYDADTFATNTQKFWLQGTVFF